jgi:hypothetical protein
MSVRLLSPEDIYDVYGCEALLHAELDKDDRGAVYVRLRDIQNVYVDAAKERIRAEARFLGVKDLETLSFASMLQAIRDSLGKTIQNSMIAQSEMMMRGAAPKIFGDIVKAHTAAGNRVAGLDYAKLGLGAPEAQKKPAGVDVGWFDHGKGDKRTAQESNGQRLIHDPKWAEIAKAYLAVEKAQTSEEIVQSIDKLNQLQHNSFHILIDLQTGRMLNDYENASSHETARNRLQNILDNKFQAGSVLKFAAQMSEDVRALIKKYRAFVK